MVIGDGALWIWNNGDELIPDAIQVVDLFHAKEKIASVAKAIHGGHSDLVKPWTKLRFAELDCGDIPALLDVLSLHRASSKVVCDAIGYLRTIATECATEKFGQTDGACQVALWKPVAKMLSAPG